MLKQEFIDYGSEELERNSNALLFVVSVISRKNIWKLVVSLLKSIHTERKPALINIKLLLGIDIELFNFTRSRENSFGNTDKKLDYGLLD